MSDISRQAQARWAELIAQMAAKDAARESVPLGQTDRDPERLRRNRATVDEIYAQPQAVEQTLSDERQNIRDAARAIASRSINRVCLVGCGDSLAVMIAMRGLLERLLGVPCEPMQALDYAYYYGLADSTTLLIALTSTGWTTKVAESVAAARQVGQMTVAVSNSPDAPIFSIAEVNLLVRATRRGWPTQSSTAAMALIAQLGIDLASARGVAKSEIARFQKALDDSPGLIHQVLQETAARVATLANRELHTPLFLFAGGGPAYASALIGAAKIKECTNRHAVAIQIEEYHHYLSQMAGEPMFITVPNGPSAGRAADALKVGRANQGRLFGVIPYDSRLDRGMFDWLVELPSMDELLCPIVYGVPLQLFAYNLGILIGESGST